MVLLIVLLFQRVLALFLIGTVIVMTATVSVSISTDADSCCVCFHRVLLGVSDKVVFIFSAFDFIFSLLEIIISFIVLMITIFDFFST